MVASVEGLISRTYLQVHSADSVLPLGRKNVPTDKSLFDEHLEAFCGSVLRWVPNFDSTIKGEKSRAT